MVLGAFRCPAGTRGGAPRYTRASMKWPFKRRAPLPPPNTPAREQALTPSPAAAAARSNRIDDLVNELGRSGQIELVEQKLQAMDKGVLREAERESWHTMMIAAAFRRGDRSVAYQRGQRACAELPESADIAFGLGQEHEFRGEVDAMLACFARAVFPRTSAAHALAMARYAYLWDRPEEGLEFIEPLISAYFELRIADDTFLYIRGLPFAAVPLSYAACFHWLRGAAPVGMALLERAAAELTEWDGRGLVALAGASMAGDAPAALAYLRSTREPRLSAGPYGGYAGIQAAVWESRTAASVEACDAVVDRVRLTESDFEWLEDARTLAKAECRLRFGGDAKDLITAFTVRQPLLFEPDHAVSFGFLEVQQELMAGYRAARSQKSL